MIALFLFTSIVGFITIALMTTRYKTNPFYNVFLFLIIMIISTRFLIQGSYQLGLQSYFPPDKGPLSILYLIIIPCFYLYNKHLVIQTRILSPIDFKHFIFIGFLYIINTYLKDSFIFYLGNTTNLIFIGLYIIFYLVLIFKLLNKNIWLKKSLHINNTHFLLIKNWTIYLFIINILAAIVLLSSIYSEINSGSATLSGKTLALPLLLFWLFIYFKILSSPEILFGLPILNKELLDYKTHSKNIDKPIISINSSWIIDSDTERNRQDLKLQEKIKANITSYSHEIDNLSTIDFIFRDKKTSPTEIAKALGVPTSHIIYLFKYHSKISFSEYRMQSRIQDAIKLIEDGFLNSETFESLAYTTGFASYNPFFIAFKKVTKQSPQSYLKAIKTEAIY